MAKKVNLDALIPRADFISQGIVQGKQQTLQTLNLGSNGQN